MIVFFPREAFLIPFRGSGEAHESLLHPQEGTPTNAQPHTSHRAYPKRGVRRTASNPLGDRRSFTILKVVPHPEMVFFPREGIPITEEDFWTLTCGESHKDHTTKGESKTLHITEPSLLRKKWNHQHFAQRRKHPFL